MNKNLFNNLFIFSDGSICIELSKYNLKNVKYLTKDIKKYQNVVKNQSLKNFSNLNNKNSYRKKLFT